MGKYFYLSRQFEVTGALFVHTAGCKSLPGVENRVSLGTFYHTRDAMKVAKSRDAEARPCPRCFTSLYKTWICWLRSNRDNTTQSSLSFGRGQTEINFLFLSGSECTFFPAPVRHFAKEKRMQFIPSISVSVFHLQHKPRISGRLWTWWTCHS